MTTSVIEKIKLVNGSVSESVNQEEVKSEKVEGEEEKTPKKKETSNSLT